nr:interaptin-like [Lepeophtheirus salmonis]
MKNLKAVILVGGYGTRLRPFTFTIPKPLFPFLNEPILKHQIRALSESGIKKIILAMNYMTDKIKEAALCYEKEFSVTIMFSIEQEPLGTGGPIGLVKEELKNSYFLVLNSDVICEYPFKKAIDFHIKYGKLCTIMTTKTQTPERFGVLKIYNNLVTDFVEKPKNFVGNDINAGIYVFSPKALSLFSAKPISMEFEVFPKLAEEKELVCFNLEVKFTTSRTIILNDLSSQLDDNSITKNPPIAVINDDELFPNNSSGKKKDSLSKYINPYNKLPKLVSPVKSYDRYKKFNWDDNPAKEVLLIKNPQNAYLSDRNSTDISSESSSLHHPNVHNRPVRIDYSNIPHLTPHDTVENIVNPKSPNTELLQDIKNRKSDQKELLTHIKGLNDILNEIQSKIDTKKEQLNDIIKRNEEVEKDINSAERGIDSQNENQSKNSDEAENKRAEVRLMENDITNLENSLNELKNQKDKTSSEVRLLDDLVTNADRKKSKLGLKKGNLANIRGNLNNEETYLRNDLSQLEKKKTDVEFDMSNDERKLQNLDYDIMGHY